MFGRKKKNKEEKKELSVKMQTIPDVFYGGKDPEIYHTHDLEKPIKKDGKEVHPKKKISKLLTK